MIKYAETIDRVYDEVSRFIILGLTGRTGSGCTTASKFLCSDKVNIPKENDIYDTFNDRKKYRIVKDYMANNWTKFIPINITTIITKSILCLDYEKLVEYLSIVLGRQVSEIREEFSSFEVTYDEMSRKVIKFDAIDDSDTGERETKVNEAWELYFNKLPEFTQIFKRALQDLLGVDTYVKLYQASGDNIRASGIANDPAFRPKNLFYLPRIINKLVKVIELKEKESLKTKIFIVIDAIRNPYEAEYFKQRHANFFLIAINTPNSERLKHLRESHKFTEVY